MVDSVKKAPARLTELFDAVYGVKHEKDYNITDVADFIYSIHTYAVKLVFDVMRARVKNRTWRAEIPRFTNNLSDGSTNTAESAQLKRGDLDEICAHWSDELKGLIRVYKLFETLREPNTPLDYWGLLGNPYQIKTPEELIDTLIIYAKYLQYDKKVINTKSPVKRVAIGIMDCL